MPDEIADETAAEPTPVPVPPKEEAPSSTGVVAGDPDEADGEARS